MSAPVLRQETPLAGLVRGMIATDGPLPLDRYMSLCLGHPEHGYYRTRDPIGRSGDFITAPEVSQMFGELLGVWSMAVWQSMGAPAAFRLVELGPGRGTLMADLLRAAKALPGFLAAASVHLVETSPVLTVVQQGTLDGRHPRLSWHDTFEDVASGPAIVLANEFIDALPVRQFVRRSGRWHERLVGLDACGDLAFGLAPSPTPEAVLPDWAKKASEDAVATLSPARDAMGHAIARRIAREGGAALIIDYGYEHSRPGDTLQAVRGHAFADPLADPGEADLTAHVDFEALGKVMAKGGAQIWGPEYQSTLLALLGLCQRAGRLARQADQAQRVAVASALHRLSGSEGMGQLFKVIAATSPGLAPPPGFGASEAA